MTDPNKEKNLLSKIKKLEMRIKELTSKIEELESHKKNLYNAIQIKNKKIDDLHDENDQLGDKIEKYEKCVQIINTLLV